MVYGKELTEAFVFLIALTASYFGVEKFRQWSLKKQIVDVPNERSSHASPTPRGGGVIFVIIALTFYAANGLTGKNHFQWAYLAGAALVALVSWLDDLFSLKTLHRFLTHGLAAFLIIYAGGFWREIDLPFFGIIDFGFFGAFLTFCWIVGLTNAYNFMDGVDGIAATQAVTAGIGWLVVGNLLGSGETAFFGGVIAFACLGFLIHNWQPAKIFMGDVGSAFLGYTFAVLPILAQNEKPSNVGKDAVFPLIGLLLVWFFVFDASYTFVYRLLKKHKVWQAHREHLYQKLVIKGFSHASVTVTYGTFSLITAAIAAMTVLLGKQHLLYALAAAFAQTILLIIFVRFGGGSTNEDESKF